MSSNQTSRNHTLPLLPSEEECLAHWRSLQLPIVGVEVSSTALQSYTAEGTFPREALRRLQTFQDHCRILQLQAVCASSTAYLLLPLIAGSMIGSLLAIIIIGFIWSRHRQHSRALERHHLLSPDPPKLVLRNLACVVLRSIRECKNLHYKDLPSSSIKITKTPRKQYRVWLESEDPWLSNIFAQVLCDTLGPVESNHYYIALSRVRLPLPRSSRTSWVRPSQVRVHPLPRWFASNERRKIIYTKHWRRLFGPGRLQNPSTKKKPNHNCRGLKARCVTFWPPEH